MDERGNWYPAQVVAVERSQSFSDIKGSDLRQSKRVTDSYNPIKAVRYCCLCPLAIFHLLCRIHFDNYAPKWDEIFTERDFVTGVDLFV